MLSCCLCVLLWLKPLLPLQRLRSLRLFLLRRQRFNLLLTGLALQRA